jgi:sec-independent protein translocase protein TatA
MYLPLAFLDVLGLQWFLLLAFLGVLLYGERLPEVAAKFGRQLMELKKAAQSVRNEIESVASDAKYTVSSGMERTERYDSSSHEESTAPKFEPPPEISAAVASGPSANESH